ncbi:hypothetical protein F2Q68_00001817 [Brassica cretica]|uniref:RRM domain-containing protein n=1 Tax=Brassica cretica TaxID=69181 RepID=A0A8S9JNP3_BRACR|nr:hypothetical protein F2Q68_00001817 [Brassica cretica]
MELESKESLSADMPSLLRRSAEAFNGGSEYRSATDLSIFSSSLPTLFHEKLESYWSQEFTVYFLFSLAVGDAKKMELEPKESLSADMPSFLRRSSEAFNGGSGYRSATDLSMFSSSLPTLFHEKQGFFGRCRTSIDELNFSGLPDELEDLDVFCTGGGMELDAESQRDAASSFVTRKRSNTSGRVSVEHPNGEHPSRTLFVRNINSSIDDSELTALFEPFGEIRSLYTACKSRGFVMISYYDIRAAHAAMRALQNTLLRKRTLDIHFSIPKENPSEKDMNQGTLVIFNVDSTVSNDELLKLFGAYGEIREIRETPNRRFHRFIEYYDVRDAEAALKALNRSEIGGKCIKLELSRPGGARRVSVPSTSQDMDRHEVTSFLASQVANSPPEPSSSYGELVQTCRALAFFGWFGRLKSVDGEDVNCVDIKKQPAFENILLKNHVLQAWPSEIPKPIGTFQKDKRQTFEAHVSTAMCPEGAVSIRAGNDTVSRRTEPDRTNYTPGHEVTNAKLELNDVSI